MGGWTGVGYDEIVPGQAWPPTPVMVTRAMLERFFRCTGRTGPVAGGTPVPAFLLNELRVLKSHLRLPPGVLHAREALRLHGAAHADEPLEVTVRIHDKYLRRGKRFVQVAQTVRHAGGGPPVLEVLHTLYWPC